MGESLMASWASRVGGPRTGSIANGGKVTAVTLSTTTAPILGISGARQQITFHNPASSGSVYVAPATNAVGGPLNPTIANPAGTFEVVAGGTLIMAGECQCGWQGFAASASSPLTIMESNI
jgi:hypothetical protein